MKMILNTTLAAAALAGAIAIVPASANAGVGVSIGIGVPAPVYGAYGPGYAGGYYYEPIYFGGAWYHGPYRWRMENGERVFFVNGGWHGNEWRGGAIPGSITFRNGGYYRDGRYDGFGGADRINARFNAGNAGMGDEHGGPNVGHADMRQERGNLRQGRPAGDARDAPHDRGNGPSN